MTILEFLIGLLISWLIWPGLMFVTALIGESRILPLWKNQSKAFIPGNMALSAIMLNCYAFRQSDYALDPENFWYKFTSTPWGIVIIGVLVLCIGTNLNLNDYRSYPARAANSPTKWVHDVVEYYVLLFLIFWFVPATWFTNDFNMYGFANIMLLGFYFIMTIIDALSGFNDEVIYARYPYDWQPIWKTGKIIRYQYRPQPTKLTPAEPDDAVEPVEPDDSTEP